MNPNEKAGARLESQAPTEAVEAGLVASTVNINSSAKETVCKPKKQSLSGVLTRQAIKDQLQRYLDLGLAPIPLKGKIPRVKWLHGNWNPKTLKDSTTTWIATPTGA